MFRIDAAVLLVLTLVLGAGAAPAQPVGVDPAAAQPLRIGILGLDTSHVVAFTKELNDPKAAGDLAGMKVVAGFPGGTDIAASRDRVQQFTAQLRGMGVEIVDTIPALLARVDAVLLESVDGRPHLEQARQVFAAGKRVFIDKPLAGSLADVLAIDALARAHGVPWFSSSSLRFGPAVPASVGAVTGCDAWSPCSLEPTHPDLFWYGIHGVETLFTVMGTGCAKVSRMQTEGTDFVTGVWKDGRIGTFRGLRTGKRGYGATVFGTKGVARRADYGGYKPLVEEIARFFRTGTPPVAPETTIEVYAFMAAADVSLQRGGAAVSVDEVLAAAREEMQRKGTGKRR